MIVCDTGPLVAALDADDHHHRECLELLEAVVGPLVVPVTVAVEVCQLIERARGAGPEAGFLRALATGELRLEAVGTADLARAADLVATYADLGLGMVDATVVAVAERLGVTELATLDRRDFTVVRPAHVDAFTLLP
ncbi:MAG: type II toxin-antitoxin system VapC family toxin [Acidimicrobiales bacterium]